VLQWVNQFAYEGLLVVSLLNVRHTTLVPSFMFALGPLPLVLYTVIGEEWGSFWCFSASLMCVLYLLEPWMLRRFFSEGGPRFAGILFVGGRYAPEGAGFGGDDGESAHGVAGDRTKELSLVDSDASGTSWLLQIRNDVRELFRALTVQEEMHKFFGRGSGDVSGLVQPVALVDAQTIGWPNSAESDEARLCQSSPRSLSSLSAPQHDQEMGCMRIEGGCFVSKRFAESDSQGGIRAAQEPQHLTVPVEGVTNQTSASSLLS